ncbi:MAG: alpha/beta fold hydrolase, partial [Deltaproteobacteria bacterium]|nr:alpha/beta fold hydrolase [Deltaproteobacteria bacterium]
MLAHSIVTARSTDPEQYMLFLHGILGTRANWRGIARTFVEARPAWGAVLVDLREHGDSLGMPTPHTVSAAATDVAELERFLDVPVGGALGHSFGGKVVLEWLRSRQGVRTEAWTIDSSPSPSAANRDTTATAEVMRTLENLPRHWVSREAFV